MSVWGLQAPQPRFAPVARLASSEQRPVKTVKGRQSTQGGAAQTRSGAKTVRGGQKTVREGSRGGPDGPTPKVGTGRRYFNFTGAPGGVLAAPLCLLQGLWLGLGVHVHGTACTLARRGHQSNPFMQLTARRLPLPAGSLF